MDIKLLILTVRILFQKENTEGVDANQINALRLPNEEDESDMEEEDMAQYPVWNIDSKE